MCLLQTHANDTCEGIAAGSRISMAELIAYNQPFNTPLRCTNGSVLPPGQSVCTNNSPKFATCGAFVVQAQANDTCQSLAAKAQNSGSALVAPVAALVVNMNRGARTSQYVV